jgi:hypothetical protein
MNVSATPAPPRAAKKDEHTAPIIFGTIGGVLVVVIVVVAVLVIRRRGLFGPRDGGLDESLRSGGFLVPVEGGHGSRTMGRPVSGERSDDLSLFSASFAES